MKSFTPQISWHNRDPILSVDIQNRVLATTDTSVSYRSATSGNDSHVIIWKVTINDNKVVAISGTNTTNKKTPNVTIECLADLTKHQRSVNCVRFSPNIEDNLLAAGDDDCVVYLWKLIDDNIENDMKGLDIKPIVKKGQEFCVKHSKDNSGDEEIELLTEALPQIPSEQSVPVKVIMNTDFAEEVIGTEVWKPYKILRGHLQDVSDICWSPDGQRLVTGSVDNMAIVWDIHKGQKLFKMVEHKGFVQGVTWDPLDKYLATLSADRSMRIIDPKTGRTVYRADRMRFTTEGEGEGTDEVESEKKSRLFYDDTLRSFCRRLTFSPGGELLIAPSGILELNDANDNSSGNNEDSNKYINTTYVFERKSLNKPSFYLPSKKYTIAVSCCPKLFQLQENLENPFPFPYRIVFAVATQDSVLFYDSQQTMPFAQVSQIHYLRLTDISWSPDGRMLIVSSTDGFATFITFETNEIGIPYDGPKHNFEELESNSPINTGKKSIKLIPMEMTPELDLQVKPKVLTPSITAFFKPSNESPEVLIPTKTLSSADNENNCQTPSQQNGLSITPKHGLKSPNILVPRKKIKLTTISTPKPLFAKPVVPSVVEIIDINSND